MAGNSERLKMFCFKKLEIISAFPKKYWEHHIIFETMFIRYKVRAVTH